MNLNEYFYQIFYNQVKLPFLSLTKNLGEKLKIND